MLPRPPGRGREPAGERPQFFPWAWRRHTSGLVRSKRLAKWRRPKHLRQLELPKLHNLVHGDLVEIPELSSWMERQMGRWVWCPACRVARKPDAHLQHLAIHEAHNYRRSA